MLHKRQMVKGRKKCQNAILIRSLIAIHRFVYYQLENYERDTKANNQQSEGLGSFQNKICSTHMLLLIIFSSFANSVVPESLFVLKGVFFNLGSFYRALTVDKKHFDINSYVK